MTILEEFDPDRSAIITPFQGYVTEYAFPDTAISCFTTTVFRAMLKRCGSAAQPALYTPGMGRPVYIVDYEGKRIALYQSPVGAPACAAVQEDIYALGAERLIIFGTCGVLDRNIPDGSVIIPDSAVRDEGTSYHYAPPSDEIALNQKNKDLFTALLREHDIPWISGKVWTTDAVYRETRNKTEKRRQQGCVCVDMECAALAAVAQFRNKDLFQFFYAADNLDADTWEPRSLASGSGKKKKTDIAELALQFGSRITE